MLKWKRWRQQNPPTISTDWLVAKWLRKNRPFAAGRKKVPARQEDTHHAVQNREERQQLRAAIGKQVLEALGQPGGLLATQVRPLWQDHYRVNVFVGLDAASAKIVHSYFLVVDAEGTIIASAPKITRQY
jgi:hypothetical protein